MIVPINKAHAYDYFKLSIQWPPTFCRRVSKCVPPVPQKFNIHGLWPQTNQSPQPWFCKPSVRYNRRQIRPIISGLEVSMKNLTGKGKTSEDKFWGHEWEKHGTCSLQTFNQLAYFNQTLHLFGKIERHMLHALEKVGITPGGPAKFATDFNRAMKNISNVDVELACTNNNLEEVRFCLDHNGRTFINCTSSGTCKGQVTLPN